MQENEYEVGDDILNCMLCVKLQKVQSVPVFLISLKHSALTSEVLKYRQLNHRITNWPVWLDDM
jgi:hypothetical protein